MHVRGHVGTPPPLEIPLYVYGPPEEQKKMFAQENGSTPKTWRESSLDHRKFPISTGSRNTGHFMARLESLVPEIFKDSFCTAEVTDVLG